MLGAVQTPHFSQAQLQQRNYALFSLIRALESAAWILILLFYSGAVVGLSVADVASLESGEAGGFARSLWYITYVIVLALGVFRLPNIIQLATFNPILIICVLWCGLTYFWSYDPSLTMRRTIALTMTTFAGLAFAARYDWGEAVVRIAIAMLILCIVTYIATLANPARGIMQEIHAGAWRGPWVEKNQLGGIMSKGVAATLCAFAMQPKRGIIWIPAITLCLSLVLLSTSKTSLLVSLGCISLFIMIRVFRRFPFLRLPVLFFLFLSISSFWGFIKFFPDQAFGLIGKDATLTGRTDIWTLLIEAISKEPMLGYGYGVFWMDPLGPSYHVRQALQWPVPTAHNGWFDAWLSGGFVVIALFSLLAIITLIAGIRRLWSGGVEAYWVILSLFFFFGFSMSESTILQQNDLSWFLFVVTASKLWARERAWWRPETLRLRHALKLQQLRSAQNQI